MNKVIYLTRICLGLFILVAPFCFAEEISKDCSFKKKYVSSQNVIIQDEKIYIVEGNNLLQVNSICYDTEGLYYYHMSTYGNCPFGHPYSPDGGCLGWNCPCN